MAEQGSTLVEGASLLAAFAALLVIGNAARGRWRETFGRRSDRYGRIARLGTGAHPSFFTAVLGEPPAMSSSVVKDDYIELISPDDPEFHPENSSMQQRYVTRPFLASTFIDRDYYIQTICNDDDTVLAFSVTTRSTRFRPVFQVHRPLGLIERWRWRRLYKQAYRPLVNVKLGRTTLADLDARGVRDERPHR
jgi:hypothetical protein